MPVIPGAVILSNIGFEARSTGIGQGMALAAISLASVENQDHAIRAMLGSINGLASMFAAAHNPAILSSQSA